LELHDQDGTLINANDDWQGDPQAGEVEAAHLAPKDARESALFFLRPPSAYTVIIRGNNHGTGIALVESYNVP
jgi:hypothetical protein